MIDELERQTQDIPEIIREPQTKVETPELSNDTQTIKQSNNNSSDIFDITWNYPVLLWFLAELYKQNIFNFKVEKIIQHLTEPLANETTLPKLQSNRLLLTLALIKLQQTLEPSNSQTLELLIFKTITNNLLTNINRETIKTELPPNNTTIKLGTSGIAWIYKQLYELTTDKRFKQEMDYWVSISAYTKSETKNNSNLDDLTTYKETAFGFLEGNTGIILTTTGNAKY